MNNATFAGRLGKDATLRYTQAGDPLASFSVAVEERRKGEKVTLWVDCTLGGKRSEALAEYLTKGSAVSVSGRVGIRQYEGKNGPGVSLTLYVQEVSLLGGGGERAPRQQQEPQPQQVEAGFDDDIPF
jgi:single-strand DNA-binding protein